jgi:hypothetical protein
MMRGRAMVGQEMTTRRLGVVTRPRGASDVSLSRCLLTPIEQREPPSLALDQY